MLDLGPGGDLATTGLDPLAPIVVSLEWTFRRGLRPCLGFVPIADTIARCLLLDVDGRIVDQVGLRRKGERFA